MVSPSLYVEKDGKMVQRVASILATVFLYTNDRYMYMLSSGGGGGGYRVKIRIVKGKEGLLCIAKKNFKNGINDQCFSVKTS
jgi:hypothetical protein